MPGLILSTATVRKHSTLMPPYSEVKDIRRRLIGDPTL